MQLGLHACGSLHAATQWCIAPADRYTPHLPAAMSCPVSVFTRGDPESVKTLLPKEFVARQVGPKREEVALVASAPLCEPQHLTKEDQTVTAW